MAMAVFDKASRFNEAAQGLASAINFANESTPAALDTDEGNPASPAAACSAKGTTSRFEDVPKGTPLVGSENSVAVALVGLSRESSPMDLDSDCQGNAAGSFSTSPIQRQISQPAAPGPGSMNVDSDIQDGSGPQGNNSSMPLTGRSPTNVVTRTKFSAGRHKTSKLKTNLITYLDSPSSMEGGTDNPEDDSDAQEQSTSRLRARQIMPLVATATTSRPTSLGHRPLRSVAKPKSAPPSPVKRSRPSASKAKDMSRHLGKKGKLKRKGEDMEERALQPIDFIDLTTDSWLRRSLTDDMEVLKARHFSI